MKQSRSSIGWVQSAVFLASGLWPLIHYDSFEAVTGRKREPWLVKTVGLLLASIGGTLLLGERRGASPQTLATLGASTAGALAAIDVVYAARGRISKVYLIDAALELAFVLGWTVHLRRARARARAEIREHG